MESFQSSIFDGESKRGEKEKYNPFHSLKFRSIPTKFLLSRLSFPRLGRKYIIIQHIGEEEILCLK